MVATPGGMNGRGKARRGSGAAVAIVGERFCCASEERQLTVRKMSLFYPGDGFAVYEHHSRCCHLEIAAPDQEKQGAGGKAECGEGIGELVFGVDSYGPDPHLHQYAIGTRAATRDELILMGPDGDCILTVRRKWPSLHQRWEGFLGERTEGQKPLFSVRRDSVIGRSSGICVEVYGGQLGGGGGGGGGRGTGPTAGHLQYRVEGSFPQRCCAVYEVWTDGEMEVEPEGEEGREGGGAEEAVVEIKRKVVPAAAGAGAVAAETVLGRDVFCLRVAPGFDAAFAMGLVLVLDRMTGDDGSGSGSGSSDRRDEQFPPSPGRPPFFCG